MNAEQEIKRRAAELKTKLEAAQAALAAAVKAAGFDVTVNSLNAAGLWPYYCLSIQKKETLPEIAFTATVSFKLKGRSRYNRIPSDIAISYSAKFPAIPFVLKSCMAIAQVFIGVSAFTRPSTNSNPKSFPPSMRT